MSRIVTQAAAFAVALVASQWSWAQDISPAGLVGLWTFDEGKDLVVTDSSGNGNDGKELFPEDKTPRWGEGEFAGSLLLTATTNNHVQVPASASLNSITTGISVVVTANPRSLWKPGDKGSGYTAIVQRQWREAPHPDQYYLGYGQLKGVLYYKWHVGLAGDAEASIYALPPGADRPIEGGWVQLAGTYDAATGEAALYVNGDKVGTVVKTGAIRLDRESEQRPLVIGAEINGENVRDTVGEFNGYLDEVRLYSRALSAAEVAALAAASPRLAAGQ